MLPLYHILLLISSDWLGPEAGSGHFCALAEGKPAQLPVVPGIERIEKLWSDEERRSGRERKRGSWKKEWEESERDGGGARYRFPLSRNAYRDLYYPRSRTRSAASISYDPKRFRLNPDRSTPSFATVQHLQSLSFSLSLSLFLSLSLSFSLCPSSFLVRFDFSTRLSVSKFVS